MKKGDRFEKVKVEDILYVQASGSYVDIHTRNGKYNISINLMNFSKQIPDPNLLRIHRSYTVNLNQIEAVERARVFIQQIEIPIGNSYRSDLSSQLKFLRTGSSGDRP